MSGSTETTLPESRRAVHEGRVLLVRVDGTEFFMVESKLRDRIYIVIPGRFCSCSDFFFSVLLRRERRKCYHLEACELAMKEGRVRVLEVSRSEFEDRFLRKIALGMLL